MKGKKTMTSGIIKFAFLIFTLSGFSYNTTKAQMFWNQACQFDSSLKSHVSVRNSSSIDLTGSFSIEVWVNPQTSPHIQTIISKGTLGTDRYGMQLLTNSNRVRIFTNGIIRITSNQPIPVNRWTHITGTYGSASNRFRIYVNGILDTSLTTGGAAPLSSTDSLFIGSSFTNLPYSGQMDEVRLWNRELSPTEVSQYFRTSLGASSGIYSGLVMSLSFQSNQSVINSLSLVDKSEFSNNGFNRGVSVVNQADRPYQTIVPNESIELDGNEDYLAAPDAAFISPTSGITLEAWVYLRNTNPCLFITKGTNYRLGYNGVNVTFGINNNFISTGVSLSPNRWFHIALSYEPAIVLNSSGTTGGYSFYLNGILRTTSTNSFGNVIDGSDSLYIGGGPAFGDMNGYIDEVRISDYAKSQELINQFLYQSIEFSNVPIPVQENVVYNLDGLVSSGSIGAPKLLFRNNARFSHPGTLANQPVSPLNRNDNSNFSDAYYMIGTNKRIPASGTSGTVSDSTTVNLSTTITDINLFVALNHTSSSNLEIVLVGPNNDSVIVFDSKETVSSDDNIITIFNDQADSSLISNRHSTFSTIIKPENNLNTIFTGDNPQGRWKLIVRDLQTNDTGFLYAWGIQFNNFERPKDLNLSSLIQGFYNPGSNLLIPDTVRVNIRSTTSPFPSIDFSKTFLNSSGEGLLSFPSSNLADNQPYYLQLIHRNSIETWSNQFTFVNDEANYSFINAAGSAFGSNQVQVDAAPVRFAIYGGDVDQDGSVDLTDIVNVFNDANAFLSGYVVTDVTGDNFVDLSDLALTFNNSNEFVGVIRP